MKKKPCLALASMACFLASPVVAWLAARLLAPNEDYTGYGAVGVAVLVLIVVLGVGVLLGVVGIWRAEKPGWLSLPAPFLNAFAVIWVLFNTPG